MVLAMLLTSAPTLARHISQKSDSLDLIDTYFSHMALMLLMEDTR
jgi:hypothetical protein